MTTQKSTLRTTGGILGLLTMLAGLWFLISPWVLGFTTMNVAFLNAIIVGSLIAIFGALDAFGIGHMSMRALRGFGGAATILGIWAVISPFVLNFGGAARWSAILTGLFVFLVSGYEALRLPSLAQANQA